MSLQQFYIAGKILKDMICHHTVTYVMWRA